MISAFHSASAASGVWPECYSWRLISQCPKLARTDRWRRGENGQPRFATNNVSMSKAEVVIDTRRKNNHGKETIRHETCMNKPTGSDDDESSFVLFIGKAEPKVGISDCVPWLGKPANERQHEKIQNRLENKPRELIYFNVNRREIHVRSGRQG